MKKNLLVITLLVIITLVGCQKAGESKNAEIDLGESKVYSQEDREKAVEAIKKEFKEFKNCEMTKIWYDESDEYAGSVIEDGKTIVFYSNFKTGDVDDQSGFSKNSEEERWSWTLERESKDGDWEVTNYGVA